MPNFIKIHEFDVSLIKNYLKVLEYKNWQPVRERGEVNHPSIGIGASKLLRSHSNITLDNWLEDLPVNDLPVLYEHPAIAHLLSEAVSKIMAVKFIENQLTGQLARAMFSRLDAGSVIFWHNDDGPYYDKTVRFHLPIITNPDCKMYSGNEEMYLPEGRLYYFNNKVKHSAANWGAHHRVHLIFEMYTK